MKRPTPSDDPDHNFEVEITSLDALERPVHASNALLQGTHLAPRVRLWLTILSVVGGLLLLAVVLAPVLSSLLPKKASTPLTVHTPLKVENVTVQDNIAYVSSSDGMWRALRMKDGSLLWQRNFPGGTPIFVKNTIYIYYYDQQFYTIQALRVSDGAPLWTFKTSSPGSIPLLLDDGVAYALSDSSFNRGPIQGQTLMALDAKSGREIWQYNINIQAPSNINLQVMQGKIYIAASSNKQTQNQTLFVLRSSDGFPLWHYSNLPSQQIGMYINSDPFNISNNANNLIYVEAGGASLNALNATNGHEVWHYKSTNSADSNEPPPAMGTNLFYIQTIEGPLKAIRASNGTLAWTYNDPWGVTSLFPEVNGILYIKTGDDFIVALQARDGKRLWHVRPIASPFTFDSIVVQGNIAYAFALIGTTNASIAALDVSNGVQLWQRKVRMGNSMAPFQISDGQFLIDSGSTVTAFREQDGMAIWHADNVRTDLQYGIPLDVEGDVAILRLYTGALEVRQVRTGAVLWRYPH